MHRLPTGTVTFLFSDIEGSTRLLQELGGRYPDVLAEHRRLLREVFARHGGIEIDTHGDSFFVAFESARDGVDAAVEAQAALADGPVRVRIGVHTGEPLVTDGEYVGVDVHLSARIMSAAHGGQVVLSQTTHDLVETEVEVHSLGDHRLKDLGSVRLYQLGGGDFPPLRSMNNSNLPAQLEPLLGRERELVDVQGLMRVDSARLVTLTGPGGTGKTRLALELAAELVPELEQGAWFVDLSSVREARFVLPTVAAALGATVSVAAHVADRALLLVLDNVEQVIDAAADVAGLLGACPRLRILATSREPLRVAGERQYPVLPLAEAPSVELFRQRASAAGSGEYEYGAIAELCARLDNLPLAIELAASRAKTLGPAQLVSKLDRRLPVLTKGRRDAPDRQRTLRSTIEWSYELCSPTEQQLFRRLAVFAGGWTLEAAEQVCDADLDPLEALVDKSLVRVRRDGGRYSMLETIREFAEERLLDEQGGEDVARRHAHYFLAFAENANREVMYEAGDIGWWRTLREEEENLGAAMRWTRASGDVELQLRLAHALKSTWAASGNAGEYRRWVEEALARGGDELPPLVRARALANAGILAVGERDPDRSRALHEQSLELYRAAGDGEGVARSLEGLGHAARLDGRLAEARALHERAAETARAAGSAPVLRAATRALADIAIHEGDELRLEELAEELERQPGLHWSGRSIRGFIALLHGEALGASRLFASALQQGHEVGHRLRLPIVMADLAEALTAHGKPRAAAVLLAHADEVERVLAVPADPWDTARRERLASRLADTLGAEAYATARAEGARLSTDDAVAYGLAVVD